MTSRLIEVFLPAAQRQQVEAVLADGPESEVWYNPLSEQTLWIRIFVDQMDAEAIADQFAAKFDGVEGFRLLLLEVEATLPLDEVSESSSLKGQIADQIAADVETNLDPRSTRVNRMEIYGRVAEGAEFSWAQIVMVLLSTAIAAIGILQDSQAVVIGAMVIAPLLQPNMALAVATTLGDMAFASRTILTGLAGIVITLAFSMMIGFAVPVNLESSEIASRLQVGWSDGILAFASGAAGAISLTTEERSSLVGVMVSVALLPPLVVLGLLLGSGNWLLGWGAALLVITNLICLNLAAVTTFLVQDLRPGPWQPLPEADRVTGAAYGIWVSLLVGLIGVVLISRIRSIGPY